jgi:hypothetical protein
LPSRLRRTRAGVHACERRGPHGRARAGTHASRTRRGAPSWRGGDERWRRPTAREERLGEWRARRRRRRHLQKLASQPGSMAGLTSSGTAAARGVPPRLEGRGVHRGGEAASSPGWPLADVQASVKGVWRCDEEGGGAGRGRRTARRKGSRGSRGRRRAWLPRVWLLLAGGSGFAAGGAAPGSSSSSPSPSPPAAGRWAGDWAPPRRLGLGEPWAATATYSGGSAGVRGRHGCTGRPRGASRRRP